MMMIPFTFKLTIDLLTRLQLQPHGALITHNNYRVPHIPPEHLGLPHQLTQPLGLPQPGIHESQHLIKCVLHILLTGIHALQAFVNGFKDLLILPFQGHMLSLLSPQLSLPLPGPPIKLIQQVLKNSKDNKYMYMY